MSESKLSVVEKEVAGHRIQIITRGVVDELWIDNAKVRYFAYDEGYTLASEAYEELLPTLLDAAARHSERHPLKGAS